MAKLRDDRPGSHAAIGNAMAETAGMLAGDVAKNALEPGAEDLPGATNLAVSPSAVVRSGLSAALKSRE
jgi:hypothetical protein